MFHDEAFLDDILLPTNLSLEEFALFDEVLPFWQDGIKEVYLEKDNEWPNTFGS